MERLFDMIFGVRGGMTLKDLRDMTRRDRFSDYLPWIAYDEDSGAYHNVDGTKGFIWECSPLSFAGEKTLFTLEGLFRLGLPHGSVMQFILYADRYIEPYVDAYRRGKTRNLPIVREATENYASFFENGVDGMDIFLKTPLRNFRLFVAVKIPEEREMNLHVKDLSNSILEILRGADLYPRHVSPRNLLDWMRRHFNDCPSLNNDAYDEEIPIRKQVIFSETVIEKSMNRMKVGNRYFRCTTVKHYPKEVDPLQTNELFGGVWGVVSDTNQIITPFLFALNIVFHNLKSKLHTKCNLVLQQQGVGSFAPSLMRKKDEYMAAVDEVEKGTPFVRVIPILWVWGKDEKTVSESIVRAKRMWEAQGYVMQEDRGILPVLFLSALPFGIYDRGDNIDNLDRDFIAPCDSVAATLPVQADFSGGRKPSLLFIGRKGQPCCLDIFDRRANNHNVFVAASSGSGKSFLVNYLAYNYFASNALVRIVDIGGSYKKMTRLFNARFLDFSEHSGVCMNPFTSVVEPASDLPVIASIVLQMVYSSTDIIPEDTAETAMSLIKSAVKWAWRTEGPEASIDTVYEYLNTFPDHAEELESCNEADIAGFRSLARNLSFNLTEFTSGHLYGKWFNGTSDFNIADDEFVVLELEHLKPQKELFKVITLQVINAVTQDLYVSDRSRPRFIIFDEAWQFMKEGSSLKGVIEEGYRRARKYGGSFTVITQSILDLKQFGSVGDVIRSNSAFKFYLESSDFDRAKLEGLIEYDGFALRILKSVRSNKPKYSEIFMDTPFGQGVARLAVDPFSYYLYTSDAAEIAEIESLVDGGLSYGDAIKDMVKRYRPAG
jgi:conjugal transfer ATP-binding protein TraC